jgi:hypothetical protein
MKADPILQEIWDIKDRLAAEAGYDVKRYVQQLREWSAEHPHTGPVVRNAEELRQLIAEKERQQAEKTALREKPPELPDKS